MAASKLRSLAAELDDADDEITAEQFFNVEPGGNVTVITGKHSAMSQQEADAITRTDNGAPPKPESEPPSKVSPLGIAWLLVRKFPPWGAVLVALAVTAAYVLLHR